MRYVSNCLNFVDDSTNLCIVGADTTFTNLFQESANTDLGKVRCRHALDRFLSTFVLRAHIPMYY